mmetsp:Transcript_11335/g.19814  ORF Transcript_11335/g.19814 Transcript_11335/m.19814 type:complete len:93 (+) Transcript_11335:57-335(+)
MRPFICLIALASATTAFVPNPNLPQTSKTVGWTRGRALVRAQPEEDEDPYKLQVTKREYDDDLAPEISFDATTLTIIGFGAIAFQFFVVANL